MRALVAAAALSLGLCILLGVPASAECIPPMNPC